MNKNELVDAVAEQVGDRRLAATTVEAVLDAVTRAVAGGERVALSGFGVFEKADRAARTARNPATGGTVQVAATAVPRFRAGQAFKDAVSGRRELPERRPPGSPVTTPARRTASAVRSAAPVEAVPADPAPSTPAPAAADGRAKAKAADKAKASGKASDKTKASGKAKASGESKADGRSKSKGKTKSKGKR